MDFRTSTHNIHSKPITFENGYQFFMYKEITAGMQEDITAMANGDPSPCGMLSVMLSHGLDPAGERVEVSLAWVRELPAEVMLYLVNEVSERMGLPLASPPESN